MSTNTKIKTRFAPSPTGFLHVGNIRTALVNYLYAKSKGGEFILRLDDTDLERCKDVYKEAIFRDLKWLGINWDDSFNQLSRIDKYEEIKMKLIAAERLYPCYETKEELDVKRKLQLSRGQPPIYDRSALQLSNAQKQEYEAAGRKPHYRFLIEDTNIVWDDMVKGEIKYKGSNLSDPIVIRADSTMTYMLCSTVDDIDYGITDILRGEDHVSNTAIQIQMFEALSKLASNTAPEMPHPRFGHLSLVKAKDDKISKREGGFEIANLRDKEHIESMAINSFFTLIGSSEPVRAVKSMDELANFFDISNYSKSPTTFVPEELELINHKLLIELEYDEVKDKIAQMPDDLEEAAESHVSISNIDEQFWLAVRPNLKKLTDIKLWWNICHNPQLDNEAYGFFEDNSEASKFFEIAAECLPKQIDENSWSSWTKEISANTSRTGKNLFMPLRLALTGLKSGPELKDLLPLLSRKEVIERLQGNS